MSCRVGLPFLASAGLLLVGCVSANTSRQLDHVHEAVTPRLSQRAAPLTDEDLSGPLDRDRVISLAIARSPSLAGQAHRVRSMVHAARAEGSLPAGELGFQAWNLPLARPYALGDADMYMVELRQRFPAIGALNARATVAAEDAEAMAAELAVEERATARRAADAYADYVHGRLNHALHQQHLGLLTQMAQAVQARVSTGGARLLDAVRVDQEIAKTQRAIARITGDITRARATLNAMLRRRADAVLGAPRETEAETVRLSLEELTVLAQRSRGGAIAADARVRAAAARREAAEAEATAPDITVGLGYWQAPSQRAGFGGTVAMTLPWLWGPNQARVDEAIELEATEVALADEEDLQLQAEVTTATAQLEAAEAELSTVHQRTLPAARRSFDALLAAYTTGSAALLEWVDAARSLLDVRVEEAELLRDFAQGVAALEAAVGAELPRVPVLPQVQP